MKLLHVLPLLYLSLLAAAPAAEGSPEALSASQLSTQLLQAADKEQTKSSKSVNTDALVRARAFRTLSKAIRNLEKHPENVNVGSKGKNLTPLMIATGLGHKEAIRWLTAHGADPSIRDASGRDCFERAKDKSLTAQLKEGGLFSWKEALAHLEAIKPEDWPVVNTDISPFGTNVYLDWALRTPPSRDEILQRCHKLAKGEAKDAGDEVQNLLLYFIRLGDQPMVSFLLRTEKGIKEATEKTSSHTDDPLPLLHIAAECAREQTAMLNLLVAHGFNKINGFVVPAHSPAMKDNKKLWKWVLGHSAWEECLENAAMYGNVEFMKAVLAKASRVEKDKEKLSMAFVKPTSYAVDYAAGKNGNDQALRFLLAHPARRGICAAEVFGGAVYNNRLDLLELLAKAKIDQCYKFQIELEAVTREAALQASLWYVSKAETLRALLPLLQEPPRTDYLSYRLLQASEDDNLELATLLLEHGADPRYANGSRTTLNVAKSDAMKKLLQEAIEKRGE